MSTNQLDRVETFRRQYSLEGAVIPRHIAVIMDGNGRWAKKRGLSRINGHHEAVKSVRACVEGCGEVGVGYLTLYAFSTENWLRPKREVQALMRLLNEFLVKERGLMMKNDVRLNIIGHVEQLPDFVSKTLDETIALTAENTGLVLTLALSYGARREIVDAARKIAEKVSRAKLSVESIDEELFSRHLETAGIPDPDLLIRTSGEYRISNFLLWQISYAELFISPVLWPNFRKEHLMEAIKEYSKRERRYGKVGE